MQRRIIWGKLRQTGCNPKPSSFWLFCQNMRNIMDISWENFELEMKYLSEEELELLKQLRG